MLNTVRAFPSSQQSTKSKDLYNIPRHARHWQQQTVGPPTNFWLTATAYRIYLQITSIPGGPSFHPQTKHASFGGTRGPVNMILLFLTSFIYFLMQEFVKMNFLHDSDLYLMHWIKMLTSDGTDIDGFLFILKLEYKQKLRKLIVCLVK